MNFTLKRTAVLVAALSWFMCMPLHAQPNESANPWRPQGFAVQGYTSVMLALGYTNYNASIEWLKHNQKTHWGIRAGFSYGQERYRLASSLDYRFAPHIAGVYFTGSKNWHPEFTFGMVFFPAESNVFFALWPIVNVGARYQSPLHPFIFRTAFGTGGIGVGVGLTI
jgi:hypothetical protein